MIIISFIAIRRYTFYSQLQTPEYLAIHFLAIFRLKRYFLYASTINICVFVTIWVLIPLYILSFSHNYKYRKAYVIRNRSFFKSQLSFYALVHVFFGFIVHFAFFDISNLFAYYGLGMQKASVITSFIGVIGSFCSIFSLLPHTNFFIYPNKNIPELVDFPELFSQRTKTIYLNVGSLAPRLAVVFDTLYTWDKYVEKFTPTSAIISSVIQGKRNNEEKRITNIIRKNTWYGSEHLRNSLANYIEIDKPERIIFLNNTSRGTEIVLETLRPRYIITTDHEHESQKQFFNVMTKRHGTTIIRVPVIEESSNNTTLKENGSQFIKRFKNACKFNASKISEGECVVVFLSHVCSSTGWILPVNEICKEIRKLNKDIPIIIDGAHAIGNIDCNVSLIDCDYYIFCGHKWLYGSPSLGLLVVNNNNHNQINLVISEVHEFLSLSPQFFNTFRLPEPSSYKDYRNYCSFKSTICMSPLISLSVTLDEFHNKYNKLYIQDNMNSIKKYLSQKISLIDEYRVYNDAFMENSPGIFTLQYSGLEDIPQYNALQNLKKKLYNNNLVVKIVYSPTLGNCIRVCLPFYLRHNDMRIIYNSFSQNRIPVTTNT